MKIVRVNVLKPSYLPLHIVCRVNNGQAVSSKHLQAISLSLSFTCFTAASDYNIIAMSS